MIRLTNAVLGIALFATALGHCQRLSGQDKSDESAELRVGIGKSDITPPIGYAMSGYYYERGATGVLDPLHAKAIVFDDGSTQLAVVVCDLIGISTDLCNAVRKAAAAATRIPGPNIMIAATHCHTAPDYYDDLRNYLSSEHSKSATEYPSRLVNSIVSAIEKADADVSKATLSVGTGSESTVSFNRRFVTTDGSIRTWANYQDPKVVRAAGPIDPALEILLVKSATRDPTEGAAKVWAALTTFALHLDTTGGTEFSADFPYHLERSLQTKYGSDFTSVFAAGTCGDINHVNPRSKERNRPHVIGARLGEAFVQAVDTFKTVEPSLRVKHRVVTVPMKRFSPHELAWATDLIAKDKAGSKIPFLDEVKAYNIRLVSLLRDGANSAALSDSNDGGQGWGTATRLIGIGDALPVEVQAMQLGKDTAIVGLPGEVFVELGLAIKQASPYRQTLVIELANSDESGYIPTRLAYQGGGYEVINSVFRPGGGEALVETAIEILREMKSE